PAVTLMARPPNRLFNLVFEAPRRKSLGADSEEKRSDIDTGVVDSLKVLDPDGRLEKRPTPCVTSNCREVPTTDIRRQQSQAGHASPAPSHASTPTVKKA